MSLKGAVKIQMAVLIDEINRNGIGISSLPDNG